MACFKKISISLALASSVLIEGCSTSETDSGPTPVANTTAPELVGEWRSDCVNTPGAKSEQSTVTYAKASGGGSGGSGGESYRDTVIFEQNGRATFTSEYFATANCNTNTLAYIDHLNFVYIVGNTTLANDMSAATELDYSTSSTTVYSMFQITGGVELFLGDAVQSTPGNDGSSDTRRFDGLGASLLKQ